MLGSKLYRASLERSYLSLTLLSLLTLALTHQSTNLLCSLILLGKAGIELCLKSLTAIIRLLNLCDNRCCIDTLLSELCNSRLFIATQLL